MMLEEKQVEDILECAEQGKPSKAIKRDALGVRYQQANQSESRQQGRSDTSVLLRRLHQGFCLRLQGRGDFLHDRFPTV